MTVESNYAIAIAALSDWCKHLALVYQPCNEKENHGATCTRDFSRALSKLHGIATNLDWFIAMFAPSAVTGQSLYFCFCFTTLNCI